MNNIIHVLDRHVELEQPHEGFRTCIDGVLLAAACPISSGESLLDLGCGVGSAGLCVLKRVNDTILHGIDILPEVTQLAQSNAVRNNLGERTSFECIDIRDFEDKHFDHVICNPPFLDSGHHTPATNSDRATAMGFGEDEMDLKDWIDCAFRSLRGTGSLTVIHRARSVDAIIQNLGKKFGDTEIIPLWPKFGKEAKRVIVRTRKHRKGPARIHPGIVLHKETHGYTDEAENILRKMQAIE